ncbi:MAG: PDZ domain-containing protein [Acidimicrobiales bacterium]|nr:PDZ domain-containing protein [Acidimicrobiales bacterium]
MEDTPPAPAEGPRESDDARPVEADPTGSGDTPVSVAGGTDAGAGDRPRPPSGPPPTAPTSPTGPPPTPPAPPTRRPRRTARIVLAIVAFLSVAFLIGAAFVPLPYYLFRPGSVRDTQPLISVEGTEVFPSDGSIGYTTVSLRQATLLGLVQGWIDDDVDVFARDEVLQGRDVDENRQVNLQMMSDSKQVATQVALERLGYEVDVTVGQVVVDVLPDTPADGVLDPGDVITAIDGETFDDGQDLSRLLGDEAPGESITATVQPPSGGAERDVELALAADPDDPDRGVMGVQVMEAVLDYDFPVDVEIDTGDVGGPSAGLAFTLGIIDDLTPGDLTGGNDVAVTGTISGDGTVGPVGGTGQKAAAVRAAGMSLFLVPSADYEAAVARAGDDLEVVAVDNVEEALAALADHGGNVDELPDPGELAAAP